MNKLVPALILAALGVVGFGPAYAQDAPDVVPADPDASLQIEQGTILHSTGGEFANASPGMLLIKGDRIIVTEGSRATVEVGNKCRPEFRDPGVYAVSYDNCASTIDVANAVVATAGSSETSEQAVQSAQLVLLSQAITASQPSPPPVSR
ncbi:MAG: hypothetical protein ABIR05_02905 [Luteimonas sp.]